MDLLILSLFFNGNIVLKAYDQHLNMILGDVEEIVTTVEIDDETYEEIVRVSCNFTLLFIIELVAQPIFLVYLW